MTQEAKRKIDGLLESLLSEYQLYSGLINKTSEARVEGLTATRDRAQQVVAIKIVHMRQYPIPITHYRCLLPPDPIPLCHNSQSVSMAAQ